MTAGILTIDVGGTGIKLAVLNLEGDLVSERLRLPTPRPCPPAVLLKLVSEAAAVLPPFDRVSVGFPGAIRQGRVLTAANLGNEAWVDYELQPALVELFAGKPVRLLNDADLQGFAMISGVGVEMVITLGTGFGSAFFRDGDLLPHVELAHHPLRDNQTYDQWLGDATLKRIGPAVWNERLRDTLELLLRTFRPDAIILGGGNARLVEPGLPPWVSIAPAGSGIHGGAALWR